MPRLCFRRAMVKKIVEPIFRYYPFKKKIPDLDLLFIKIMKRQRRINPVLLPVLPDDLHSPPVATLHVQ